MGKAKKYLLNMGLAFDEDRILRKVGELAKEGWFLKKMTMWRYIFEQGEPQELIYSIDYKKLDGHPEEYFQFFQDCGWQHRCSYYNSYHFFSATPETVPIYTEHENFIGKYKETRNIYHISLISSVLLILLSTLIYSYVDYPILKQASTLVGALSAMIAAPSLMVTIAYAIRCGRDFEA